MPSSTPALTGENGHVCGPQALRVPGVRALSPVRHVQACQQQCPQQPHLGSVLGRAALEGGTWTPPLRDVAFAEA